MGKTMQSESIQPARRPLYRQLYFWVLIAIVAGIILG